MQHQCPCGHMSFDGSNMKRHKKTCKKLLEMHFEEKINQLEQIIKQKDIELENKNAEISRLHDKIHCYTQSALSSGTTNVYNNNNQYHINIIPYGDEPALDEEAVLTLLDRPDESVPKYIEMKHFARENTANIRILNKRGNTCQIVEEDLRSKRRRWVELDKKIVISDMTEANLDELRENYNAEKNVIWRTWYRNNGLHEDGYDKKEEFKKMVRAVENVIVTNRDKNIIC